MAGVRTFIAIGVEGAIVARLTALQAIWRQADADIGWVPPEALHLTLKFFGDVPEEDLLGIEERLLRLASRYVPFSITIAGAGGFPNLTQPRVLWAGVTAGAQALQELAALLDETMAELGFPREARPYRAHLTLGRVKSPAHLADLLPLVAAHAGDHFGSMRVHELRLLRSDFTPNGARYRVLCQAALRPDVPPT